MEVQTFTQTTTVESVPLTHFIHPSLSGAGLWGFRSEKVIRADFVMALRSAIPEDIVLLNIATTPEIRE